MRHDLARSALWYARHGWRVFPCLIRDKTPAIRAWQKLATTDPKQVAAWWSARPDSNVGIACGPKSDLYVIDVDVKDGKDGEADLGALIDELGPLPATPCQRTGSGGRQLFFRMPDGKFKNSRGKIAKAIDTRAGGGYVVAPPSVHPCGDRYTWIRGPHQVALAEMPETWRKRFEHKEPMRIAAPVRHYDSLSPIANRLIDDQAALIVRSKPGTRNDNLYRSAFMLAVKAKAGLLSWNDASVVLFNAAVASGLNEREVSATLRSAEKGAASCR